MKLKVSIISDKIILLSKTILESVDKSDKIIIKNFTETGIKILGADFGFAWWKFDNGEDYELAYKTKNMPFDPYYPREGSINDTVLKTKRLIADSSVKKEKYPRNFYVHVKSQITIPIWYGKYTYGSLVLCFKEAHEFTSDELTLAQAIGNSTAQAITIHQLVAKNTILKQREMKTEFIANAAHELRTPLAIMKGNVDLALLDGKNINSAKDALNKVNNEISILSEILVDLAVFTSSEKDLMYMIQRDPINISTLINQLTERLKTVAKNKNISIQLKNENTSDLIVLGDQKYLNKLFLNILSNAISYGRENGYVMVKMYKEKNKAKIEISDNGIGISKEDRDKIFQRFYRTEGARIHNSRDSHSGIGLAIAKWVAEKHGGNIEVKSTEGKGSTFTIFLPLLLKKSKNAK